MRYAVSLCVLVLALNGCAAMMARRGTAVQTITPGGPRADIEKTFGKPSAEESLPDGWTSADYTVRLSDPARSEKHLVASLFTYGLWELVGVPYEWRRGPDTLGVLYSGQSRVLAARGAGAPSLQMAATRKMLLEVVGKRIEDGGCPALTPCVEAYATELRRLADWAGYRWLATDQEVLDVTQRLAADADAGTVPREEAIRLLVSDAALPR